MGIAAEMWCPGAVLSTKQLDALSFVGSLGNTPIERTEGLSLISSEWSDK
jgi:hypothetical protein